MCEHTTEADVTISYRHVIPDSNVWGKWTAFVIELLEMETLSSSVFATNSSFHFWSVAYFEGAKPEHAPKPVQIRVSNAIRGQWFST